MKLSAKGEIIFVVEEDPAGGFVANALNHGITTQAETMDELREMVREAVDCYFDDDDPARPQLITIRWTYVETFAA